MVSRRPKQGARPQAGAGTHYDGSAEEVRALGAFVKLMRAARWASIKAGSRREETGLSESQFGVLEAIYHLGPLDQTELARKVLTSPSNLTLVIDNLEREGYVERRRSAHDRRRRVIHLEPAARRLLEELLPRHVERIVEVMAALSPEEQIRLGELCRKLGRAAELLE